MQDIATKTEGSQLTADEFNQIPSEIENAIISTGQTLTYSNLEQLATSLAIYSSKGDFYSTSGTANAITLSPISSMKSISSYSLGTKVRFIANSNNSDVVTISISNLTSVNLLNSSGSPLIANELLQGYEYTATFDGTNFRLNSNYNSVQAQLDTKANDSEVVHLVDNETILGAKTFSSSPQVPNVTSGDSSTNSANTKFVTTAVNNLQSQVNSNFVNLTGTQTITGTKTFAGAGFITYIQNTDVTYNTAPSADTGTSIVFVDKNGTQMGVVECWRAIDNSTSMRFNVYGANGSWSSQPLQLRVDANGNTYAYAPTPDVGSNSTDIATTAYVKNVLSALYPVGSLYIGTQNSCPLASLISGSQWQIIATDCALWGGNGSNGNTWIPAGLPNITGQISCINDVGVTTQGQFAYYSPTGGSGGGLDTAGGTSGNINFDASRVSSIYGNSNTVQPPAYRVNVWRRIA